MKSERLNEKLICVLNEIVEIMERRGEKFRAKAYRDGCEEIMRSVKDIKEINDIKGMSRIGKAITSKLEEYIETGKVELIEKERDNPINKLLKVYGIGPKKGEELIKLGIKSIEELKRHPELLTENMKIGLKYYEELEEVIPREEIDMYKEKIDNIFKKNEEKWKGTKYEIVGSYRRGKKSSGDIDIIVTNKEDNRKIFIFDELLNELIKEEIMIEILTKGMIKCMGIGRLKGCVARRVDVLYSPPEEYPYALLYFTGSKVFNTLQRQRAQEQGYSLNEHGLYKYDKEKGKKGEKIEKELRTEMEIFEYLKMEYRNPEERIDGRSIKDLELEKIIVKRNNIEIFKKKGVNFLKQLNENDLNKMIKKSNERYYENKEPILKDEEYDILIEYTKNKYPRNEVVNEGHTKSKICKNKVKLPYEMWSMDKIKADTEALYKWKDKYKGENVLSCKLDGISSMYSTENGEEKLYTRGNGKIGQDISYLIPYLNLPKEKNIVIRGEIIIKKKKFEEKYNKEYSNGRNFVAGVVNQKKEEINKFKDLDYVGYELIKPEIKPSEQIEYLKKLKMNVVRNEYIKEKETTNEILSEQLLKWRKESEYEIDGIICKNDKIYERKSGNPEDSFAFKMVISEQIAETKVVDVKWSASKDGYLKPRVQLERIILGGVEIEWATGFNGKFINDNKIGIGSVIRIVRSGDVIPHIISVIKHSEVGKMPSEKYKWNESGVDIILEGDLKNIDVINEKIITQFFKVLGVEGLSIGLVRKLMNNGYDSIKKIINIKKEDLLNIDGFKDKLTNKICDGIKEKITKATLEELMHGTNIFGRGFATRTFNLILENYPTILTDKESDDLKIKKLISVNGMAEITAKKFINKKNEFINWIKDVGLEKKLYERSIKIKTDHPLYGKKWIMTGSRDKMLKNNLEKIGAIECKSVTKNTDFILVNNLNEDTQKVLEGKKLNIPIITFNEFYNNYFTH